MDSGGFFQKNVAPIVFCFKTHSRVFSCYQKYSLQSNIDLISGQRDPELFSTTEHNQIIVKTIPPKTTALIQPLDVYFFRQYKMIARRIYDYARTILDSTTFAERFTDREFIIKLHEL